MLNDLNSLTNDFSRGDESLRKQLLNVLPPIGETAVVLCIGSDRVTGDCLGPVTGHILKNELYVNAEVYGTLSDPVTALNLEKVLMDIHDRHPFSPVIAIDSALGKKADIGRIRVVEGGIYPGAATSKNLPKVGDIAITATVAENSGRALYSVRLGLIFSLSKRIALAVSDSLNVFKESIAL